MFGLIIIVIIIIVVFFVIKNSSDKNYDKIYTIDSPGVNKDFANEMMEFFDGFFSLCKNHEVIGRCCLLKCDEDQFKIESEAKCIIFSIDGEHGDEAFGRIKSIWNSMREEKLNMGEYSAAEHAGDIYIEKYFGSPKLHYVFTDADEYRLNQENGDAIIEFNRSFFTRNRDAKWQATISFIRQELLKKEWINAEIDIVEMGIRVTSKTK